METKIESAEGRVVGFAKWHGNYWSEMIVASYMPHRKDWGIGLSTALPVDMDDTLDIMQLYTSVLEEAERQREKLIDAGNSSNTIGAY